MVLFDIDSHEKEILAVGCKNKTIESKDKCNQLNILDMKYLLGNNFCRPLLHISKSYIWLEEKNQRINELYIGYTMNPNLHINKVFKEQVKECLKTHIWSIYQYIYRYNSIEKKYKSVSIGCVL